MADKIVIRVAKNRLRDKNASTAPPLVVEYYWKRIIGAAVAVVAIVLGLIWTGTRLFDHPSIIVSEPAPAQLADAATTVETGKTAAESNAVAPSLTILSKHIKRAQLTSDVVKDEPVDRLGSIVPMNAKGLVRVFLFIETADLKGKTLFHNWYWNGKLIAHVKFSVLQNRQVFAPRKYISRVMTGNWQTTITDDKNKVLAKAEFQVR